MLHIDLPSRSEIERLAAWRGAPAVSIYLRTTPLTEDAGKDRIELKNLLKTAVAQLEEAGTDKRQIWPIEEAVSALAEDDAFWAFQANSLAIFVTPERVMAFRLPNLLTSMVEVSDRFHLKPILRALTFPHHAYVLPIGMGAVRLVESRPTCRPMSCRSPACRRTRPRRLAGAATPNGPGRCARAPRPASTRSSCAMPGRWIRPCARC